MYFRRPVEEALQRQHSGHNTPLGYYTDCSPTGFGQYVSLGEYCDPNTASSVFLVLFPKYSIFMSTFGVHAYVGCVCPCFI